MREFKPKPGFENCLQGGCDNTKRSWCAKCGLDRYEQQRRIEAIRRGEMKWDEERHVWYLDLSVMRAEEEECSTSGI